MANQLAFKIKTHGGPRRGAGRQRAGEKRLAHVARPKLSEKIPSHITLKFKKDVPNLRCEAFLLEFTRAIGKAKAKGLAVTQFSIESNHIYMLIEVQSNDTLKRGVLSLQGCITWGLRRVFKYFGIVFADRFHLHAFKSPREMKHALGYVIFNHAKHCGIAWFRDVYSSGFAQHEFAANIRQTRAPKWQSEIESVLSQATSWLQRTGWKRAVT